MYSIPFSMVMFISTSVKLYSSVCRWPVKNPGLEKSMFIERSKDRTNLKKWQNDNACAIQENHWLRCRQASQMIRLCEVSVCRKVLWWQHEKLIKALSLFFSWLSTVARNYFQAVTQTQCSSRLDWLLCSCMYHIVASTLTCSYRVRWALVLVVGSVMSCCLSKEDPTGRLPWGGGWGALKKGGPDMGYFVTLMVPFM